MTKRSETREILLNEFVGTALGIAAGLGVLGGAAYATGQKRGTGFRYRMGERVKNALTGVDQFFDNMNAEEESKKQEHYHRQLGDAMGLKSGELAGMMAQHDHITSIAPDRAHIKPQIVDVLNKKSELDKNIINLQTRRRNLQASNPTLYTNSHPDIVAVDNQIAANNVNNHIYTGHLPHVIESRLASGGPRSLGRILNLIANTPYTDLHGRPVPRRGGNGHYTVRDIVQDTALEDHLARHPSARSKFASMSKYVFGPSSRTMGEIDTDSKTRETTVAARQANIQQDLLRTRQEVAQPPKNPFESGISMGERLTRLKRNRLFDTIRTTV